MVCRIGLTNGGYALVDKEDWELVSSKGPWYGKKGRNTRYAVTTKRKGRISMHRLIMGPGPLIDHINEDGLDNRKRNLQRTTHSHNSFRRSLTKGYRKWGNVYQVRMKINGKKYVESYKTEDEAIARVKELKSRPPSWFIREPD